MNKSIDKPFLISIIILAIFGFFVFTSASLGLLARDSSKFTAIATNQFLFGICLGGLTAFLTSRISFKVWKKWSLFLFIGAVLLTLLVFVPGLGMRHGGALRWLSLGGFTFQPSEVLKLGYIFYLGAVLAKNKNKLDRPTHGLIPFCILSAIVAVVIGLQPDNDTVLMTLTAGATMFFVAGAKKKDIMVLGMLAVIGLGVIFTTRPYVRERVMTFFNPSQNSLSSGYQIQQSMIAIGSGGMFGKGFGQSTQKFSFLPEPIGDSIFAVASEEFGFIGSVAIVVLFLFFAFRGLKIAKRSQDEFGRLITLGIVIMVIMGSFINISAMLGIIPLSGTPLVFISHGGTSLFITLAMMGIILNVSRVKKTN